MNIGKKLKTISALCGAALLTVSLAACGQQDAAGFIGLDAAKAIALGALPIWTDLLADKELLAAYPYWENFGSQIDKATGLPSVLWYDEFVEILTVESQRIMLGEISVEDGLASMQTQCEALEAEYSK